jgi:ABC-type transport system involved in multi-copper enzyme maturation permease subunit
MAMACAIQQGQRVRLGFDAESMPFWRAMITRHAATIAHHTLLEAARNRMLWIAFAILLTAVGLAAFLGQVAITESREIGATVVAAFLRLAAVFLAVAFVVTSMVRELNDKVLEIVLSHPVPRASYLLGKFVGFSAAALLLATLFSLPLLMFAPALRVLAWGGSLALELLVMSAVSLFCVLTLNQVVAALAATTGFYILSRSIVAAQIIAASGGQSATWMDRLAEGALSAIGAVLPAFSRMTRSDWLVTMTLDWMSLAGLAGAAVVYVALIVAAALFDFHRQNF